MAFELIKVSELPELTTPSDPNVIPIQDGDYLKRISFENLKEAVTDDVADDLAAEVTARESAVSDEATARGNADAAILADLASAYSASATYAVGDYCTKDGQLYRCTTAISTAEAWTAAHWSAVALGDDTSDLRSALTSVNADAIKRDMTYHPIVNVLNPNDLTAGYLDTSGGHHNNQYRSYTGFIPVAEGDILRCYRRVSVNTLRLTNDGFAKFYVVTAYNASKVAVPSSGKSSDTTPYTVPSGIAYVRLSVYNELKDGKGMATINNEVTEFVLYGDSYTANSAFLEGVFTETTEQPVISKGYRTVTGALNDGDKLEIESTTCKYGLRYAFSGKITSFSSITLSHGGSSAQNSSWIVVDGTKITVYGRYNTSSPIQTYEYTHGLTISDFISIEVILLKDRRAAKVYLQTNGGTYVIDEVYWYGYSIVNIAAESNGSVLTDCVLSFSSSEFRKSLWLFGDSYISDESTARWAYYLKQDGFLDNVMLAGYPGAAPREMYPLFVNSLAYGRPYMCVWALGMNGDADPSSTTVGTLYYDYLMWFLDKCKIYNIIPILCTIPTVPSLYHEARNSFIRSSGYRYIDFADAVGAQADGTWYSGMLSEDNVHPTPFGAQALYLRALRDCPELTYGFDAVT